MSLKLLLENSGRLSSVIQLTERYLCVSTECVDGVGVELMPVPFPGFAQVGLCFSNISAEQRKSLLKTDYTPEQILFKASDFF